MISIRNIRAVVEKTVENVENEKNRQTMKKGVDNWGMVWYSNKAVSQERRMPSTEKEILKKDEKSA